MRISKTKKFAVEQYLIQQELISLLNLKEGFYLYDLDRDKKKQQQILDMVPEIWKYFTHMNVTGLLYPEKCKRTWLSIIRGVFKNKYYLKYKACRLLTNQGSIFTMKYHIEPIPKSDLTDSISTSVSSDSLYDSSIELESSEKSTSLNKKIIKKQLCLTPKYLS